MRSQSNHPQSYTHHTTLLSIESQAYGVADSAPLRSESIAMIEDIPTTFSAVMQMRMQSLGMSIYKLQKELKLVGHSLNYKQLKAIMDGKIQRKRWDSILMNLSDILDMDYPNQLLGLPEMTTRSKAYRQPWPMPLLIEMGTMSNYSLARLVGRSNDTVYSWTHNSLPSLGDMFDLARALDVPVQRLIPNAMRPTNA